MNPMTNIKNTQKISNLEIDLGTAGTKNSWHNRYKDSAWIFIGGLPYDLTEGDVICVFSQCGEIVNCNMVRDQKTGKSKGFMFLCYEDQRSTILAVDNLNGIKILNRTIRVDHVLDYKPPKDHDNDHELTKQLKSHGCAPQAVSESESEDSLDELVGDPLDEIKKEKKHLKKKMKKEKKKKKEKRKNRSPSPSSSDSDRKPQEIVIKKEKIDPRYGDVDDQRGDRRHGNNHHDNKTQSRDKNDFGDRRGRERDSDRVTSPGRHNRRSPVATSRDRRRSQSPRRRSPSPRRRGPSPRQRSPSPRRRGPSPRRRGPSPRQRSPSPKRRGPSPRRRRESPRHRSRSPRRRSPSPPRRRRSRSRSPRGRSRDRLRDRY